MELFKGNYNFTRADIIIIEILPCFVLFSNPYNNNKTTNKTISFCRSLFAGLVPRGRESEFFGLYAITDKGSSWLGPLAVATITDRTHEIRDAFVFLLILLSIPIPIIYFGVDLNQGRIDAEKVSVELQKNNESGTINEHDHSEENTRLLSNA